MMIKTSSSLLCPFVMFAFFLLLTLSHAAFGTAWRGPRNFKESEIKCVPESRFIYDHNSCTCDKTGTEMTCTKIMYSMVAPVLQINQLHNLTFDCEPGSLFESACKNCICHDSGKFAICLGKSCNDSAILETPKYCIPGSVFPQDCNGCICGPDATAACTNLDCSIGVVPPNRVVCVPNSVFEFECNTCGCTSDGKRMMCDRMACSKMEFYHENLLNVTMNCQPNKIFNHGCHECVCYPNGQYAMCYGMNRCPSPNDIRNGKTDTIDNCKPGMIFANGCNTCICGSNGKGFCTTLNCDYDYRVKYT